MIIGISHLLTPKSQLYSSYYAQNARSWSDPTFMEILRLMPKGQKISSSLRQTRLTYKHPITHRSHIKYICTSNIHHFKCQNVIRLWHINFLNLSHLHVLRQTKHN